MKQHLPRLLTQRAAGIFLAAFFLLAASLRAAIPPAEKLLPADTLFFVTVPDCTAMAADLKKSPQFLFWNDPAMRPFHDKFMGKWNSEFVGPLEKDLGVKLSDFTSLLRGQLTLALTQNGWDGTDDQKTPGFVLLLDAKDQSGLLQTNLAALQRKWSAAGKNIRTETAHGISFSIVPLSSNDVPPSVSRFLPHRQPVQVLGQDAKPAAAPTQMVVGQFRSLLIVGSSLSAIEPVAAHLTGGSSPALADNAVFAADQLAHFRNSPLYYGWFNGKTLFDVLAKIPSPDADSDADTASVMPRMPWNKILTSSGLMGLKSATFAYRETPDGATVDFSLDVPEAGRTGIFQMLAASSKDANPPSFVPADAVKFWRWRVDGAKAWTELQKMVAGISPQAAAQLNSAVDMANMMGQQKDPNFDIRKSLLANLGDDFMSYQKAPADASLAALGKSPTIFLFASPDADQAAVAVKSIATLLYRAQNPPEPRDFLGKKIYTIPSPAAAGGAATALYCAAGGGYVALTGDVSMLETFLRNLGSPGKPLRDLPGLAEATQRVGGAGNGLFGYENQSETMRAAMKLMKSQAANDPGAGAPSVLPKGLQDWMDFSLLPDFDAVAKYFYFSVYAGNVTSDGLSLKIYGPRPPQLR